MKFRKQQKLRRRPIARVKIPDRKIVYACDGDKWLRDMKPNQEVRLMASGMHNSNYLPIPADSWRIECRYRLN